jgi:hypothetical protein
MTWKFRVTESRLGTTTGSFMQWIMIQKNVTRIMTSTQIILVFGRDCDPDR